MMKFMEKFSMKVYCSVAVVFLLLFIGLNYRRVYKRGIEWYDGAEPVGRFLVALKRNMPAPPPNSTIIVFNLPYARVGTAIRAYYQREDINLTIAETYNGKPGKNAFIIFCRWKDDNPQTEPDLLIYPIRSTIREMGPDLREVLGKDAQWSSCN